MPLENETTLQKLNLIHDGGNFVGKGDKLVTNTETERLQLEVNELKTEVEELKSQISAIKTVLRLNSDCLGYTDTV